MNVAERIKYLREKKGYTVNKLSNMAGLSQSFVRELELGNKKPTVDTLEYICDALGISLFDFFNDGTIKRLEDDETFAVFYELTPVQRFALCEFIKSL